MQTAEDGPPVPKDLSDTQCCIRMGKFLIGGDGEGKEGVMDEFG